MILNSYAIYQSVKAMEDFYEASKLAPMKQISVNYISEEVAAANLEMAILYYRAYFSAPKS